MVLDVSCVLLDPEFLVDMTLERASVGGYISGIWQPPSTTTVSFRASSQVASEKELRLLPEGERNKEIRSFYSVQSFQTSKNNVPADIITDHLGEDWKIVYTGNWSIHGYYHCMAEALAVGSPYNPPVVTNDLVSGYMWNFSFEQTTVLDVDDDPVAAPGDDAYVLLSDTVARQCAIVQGSGATFPQWFSDPKLTFSGDYWYTFGNLPGMSALLSDFTVFFVLRPDITTGEILLCNGNAFAVADGITIRLTTEATIYRQSGTAVSAASGGTMDTVGLNIIVAQVDTSGTVYARLVNAAGDDSNTTAGTISDLTAPGTYDYAGCAGSDIYQGDVFQSFMYDRVLSVDEIDQNVAYLQGVYSI